MARTVITPQVTLGAYPTIPYSAGGADTVLTAVDDPTDRYCLIVEGKTFVLAINSDSGAHTITFTSVIDTFNRPGDISAYSIAAGKIATFGPFKASGWAHSTNQLYIDVSDPKVRLAVFTLP